MTIRQRVISVFEGRVPDVMPWFADLTYWITGQRNRGTFPKEYEGDEGYLQLHKDLGVGVFLYSPSVYYGRRDESLFTSVNKKEGELDIHEVHTPEGILRSARKYCPMSLSSALVEYAVKTPIDLNALRCFISSEDVFPNYEPFERRDALWGEDGIPVLLPPRTPLARLIVEWAGIENLAFLVADYPEEVEKTIDVIARKEDEIYEIICRSPALVVEFPDNLTAETSGGFFKRYSVNYYVKRINQLHKAGKIVGVHLDGTMRGLISTIAATGIDYIESITPEPVGDVPIEELRSLVAENTILWGGIPGAMFAPPFTWDELERHVEKIIACHANTGIFVLATADQVPPNGDIDFVRRISEMLERL